MGMEVVVPCERVAFDALLAALAKRGLPGLVAMVDGQLQMPGSGTIIPETWRDVRLRLAAGTLTLARRPGGVAVIVFGNADAALRNAQQEVVEALRGLAAL